ncbi:hypothetical protein Hanom_Chr07g00669561 [Helianthus anomalus]
MSFYQSLEKRRWLLLLAAFLRKVVLMAAVVTEGFKTETKPSGHRHRRRGAVAISFFLCEFPIESFELASTDPVGVVDDG